MQCNFWLKRLQGCETHVWSILPQDMFTSLTGASKPHHMVNGAGVVLGYSHFGMLAGARWLLHNAQEPLRKALQENPGLKLKIVGHSLGGGTAAMLTMM
jgi:hypothetical protein